MLGRNQLFGGSKLRAQPDVTQLALVACVCRGLALWIGPVLTGVSARRHLRIHSASKIQPPTTTSRHVSFRGRILNIPRLSQPKASQMKRCTAAAISTRLPVSRGWQSRRWASHDRASLSKETVLENIEAGLGRDAHGNPIHIDVESKTVSTDAGDLPISPVFDPAWIKSRRRERKNDPGKPTGRLRRKLTLNPYGTTIMHLGVRPG